MHGLCCTIKEVIKMPEEMLTCPTGGSTPGLAKSVVYDTTETPESGIRKIVYGANAALPTSDRMVQGLSTWVLDVAMARSVMGGKLWGSCTECGKRYTHALYLRVEFGDLNRGYILSKKPRFKKSEMHGDLPFENGTAVSASERRGGAWRYKCQY
ncbi:MAG: hypothetical protein C4B59_09950 [Candidatus Methanogaster sp.]|uniref:Uncharacterized protein n=1 Tax=Candidatus Methanogaster sp. TaxID=3386292 RepID=A0AC61L1P7_9EURY|nr:MAG: hypothetical protein C4B59_09950 [ANME-2 cluster archaeon]